MPTAGKGNHLSTERKEGHDQTHKGGSRIRITEDGGKGARKKPERKKAPQYKGKMSKKTDQVTKYFEN